nr:MAG TPA: hypothetical protein [Caudoviricetes sp.]
MLSHFGGVCAIVMAEKNLYGGPRCRKRSRFVCMMKLF